jgi:hypothetical protein
MSGFPKQEDWAMSDSEDEGDDSPAMPKPASDEEGESKPETFSSKHFAKREDDPNVE